MGNTIRKKISVVLPAHNEEKNLPGLVKEILSILGTSYEMEVIIVDDGSLDGTEKVINDLSLSDSRVGGVILYRNYGHQAALMAGISKAVGDAVITMDSDYQHPPTLLTEMVEGWETGSDLVVGKKTYDVFAPVVIRIFRTLGYKIYSLFRDSGVTPGVSDFRLMDRNIVKVVINSNEKRLILRSLVHKYARNPTVVEYKVGERKYGRSSYTWGKLYSLFVTNIVSSSLLPLRLTFFLGTLAMVFSVVMIGYVIIAKIFLGTGIIQGWATTVILVSFYFGLNFFCLGILAEYLGVIFDEVKGRPRYTVKREINLPQSDST